MLESRTWNFKLVTGFVGIKFMLWFDLLPFKQLNLATHVVGQMIRCVGQRIVMLVAEANLKELRSLSQMSLTKVCMDQGLQNKAYRTRGTCPTWDILISWLSYNEQLKVIHCRNCQRILTTSSHSCLKHPQINGQVERCNASYKGILRKLIGKLVEVCCCYYSRKRHKASYSRSQWAILREGSVFTKIINKVKEN